MPGNKNLLFKYFFCPISLSKYKKWKESKRTQNVFMSYWEEKTIHNKNLIAIIVTNGPKFLYFLWVKLLKKQKAGVCLAGAAAWIFQIMDELSSVWQDPLYKLWTQALRETSIAVNI